MGTTNLMKDTLGIAGMAGAGHNNLTIGVSAMLAFGLGTGLYMGIRSLTSRRHHGMTSVDKELQTMEEVEVVDPEEEETEK